MLKKLINYIKNYDEITQLQNDYEALERSYNKIKEDREYYKEKILFDDSKNSKTEKLYYKLRERIINEIIQVQSYSDKNITLKLKRILDEIQQQQIKNS